MPESYTGNEGTTAAAAGMAVMDGTEDRRNGWLAINKARDYIASKIADTRTWVTTSITDAIAALWPLSIARGGTGKTTAAAAAANLGVWRNSGAVSAGNAPLLGWNGVRLQYDVPGYGSGSLANLTDVGSGYLPLAGGTLSGHLYLPNSVPANSGYAVAYINSDGRVSRGASSARYKKFISDIDPAGLGDIWPQLVRYQMRSGDGAWKYGYIAERLDESDALRPFVIYQTDNVQDPETGEWSSHLAADENGNPIPESIDFIALLMSQAAQLQQRVEELEAHHAEQ